MLFINQLILTKQIFPIEFPGERLTIEDYKLYYHKTLSLAIAENVNIKVVAIGDLYDYEHTGWGNQKIVESWLQYHEKFNEILHSTYKYSGEYIILYFNKKSGEFKIFSDTTGQFELYFSIINKGEIVAGSTHRIIKMVTPLIKDTSPGAIEFFNSKAFKERRAFIGSDTNYINLKRLIPNHYLNLYTGELVRYFPAGKKNRLKLEEASLIGAKMLKGFIKAAANRHKLLIPVTAGWDSRVILAAAKEVAEKSIFYVYFLKGHTAKYDKNIPKKLFNKLNIPIRIVERKFISHGLKRKLLQEVEQDILFPRYQTHFWIKEFFKKYPGYLALSGNLSEIIRHKLDEVYFLSPKKIAHILDYPFLKYSLKRYSNWLKYNKPIFKFYHYRVLDMLHWEENCGNWVAKIKTERKIRGVKTFSPFNSRELILTLYGVPKSYRQKENPILYKKMIKHLWPEVMQVPVNPGLKQKAIQVTQILGIFTLFRNLKLWWNLLKGMNKW